jgi:hypothetical protein
MQAISIRAFFLLLSIFTFSSGSSLLQAQQIVREQIIPIQGYDVRQVGYPHGLVPVGGGKFAYVQFWRKSKMHPADNYYLQALSSSNFAGEWYHQVVGVGEEPFRLGDLFRLGDRVVVTGQQYRPKSRRYQTVARYFDLKGKPVTLTPVELSDWERRARPEEKEYVVISPKQEKMLWMGREKDQFHFSLWDENGRQVWKREKELPEVGKKYELESVELTDKGFPLFLLRQARPSFSIKDTLYPPLLLRYHPFQDTFRLDTLALDSAFDLHVKMKLLDSKELVVTGICSQGEGIGLKNGERALGSARYWSGIFLKRLKLGGEEVEVLADSVSPVPEELREFYGEEGSDFTNFELLLQPQEKSPTVVLLFEEAYEDKNKFFFYDVGCFALSSATGELLWSRRVPKKQRSVGGKRLLSYFPLITSRRLHLVYLSERGARGKLACSSLDLQSGNRREVFLASNEDATYLFFPKSSGQIAPGLAVLMGVGNPNQSDYKLITVRLE